MVEADNSKDKEWQVAQQLLQDVYDLNLEIEEKAELEHLSYEEIMDQPKYQRELSGLLNQLNERNYLRVHDVYYNGLLSIPTAREDLLTRLRNSPRGVLAQFLMQLAHIRVSSGYNSFAQYLRMYGFTEEMIHDQMEAA